MQRYIPVFVLTVILAYTIGCNKRPAAPAGNFSVLRPLTQTEQITDLAPFVSEVELVQIPVGKNTMLADITKMLIDRQGNLFVMGERTEPTALRPDGSLLRQIALRGKGPREFLHCHDMALSQNGTELMLLDDLFVRCYGINDSTHYSQIRLPRLFPLDALAPASNGGVYLFGAFPADYETVQKQKSEPMLLHVDKNGEIIGSYVDREDVTFSIGNITQSANNQYLLRPQNSRHEVWRLTPDSLQAAFRIDFANKNIPANYYFEQAGSDFGKYAMAPYYKIPMQFCQTDDQLYFKAPYAPAEHHFLYELSDKKGISWLEIPDDMSAVRIMGADRDWFYVVVQAEAVQIYHAGQPEKHGALFRYAVEYIRSRSDVVRLDGNPIILKLKFRITA